MMNRPEFPKRAVITAGMPYGNKSLHFAHIGAIFIPADVYARFLRDRIGEENVIFVSGTDCYGSPIEESHRKACESGEFSGTLTDFISANHERQKSTIEKYEVAPNLFSASGLGNSKDIHAQMTDDVIRKLYENGYLQKMTTSQFYDPKVGKFLNGRQVTGICPIQGCKSEKAYADECSLGHSYMPSELINPKSCYTGETPEMRDVVNWYFKLPDFLDLMKKFVDKIGKDETVRPLTTNTINEFLLPPIIYIKNELEEEYDKVKDKLPKHKFYREENKSSFSIEFDILEDREKACEILTENSIRYRPGKTLTPFRLTGNAKWGVPAPELEDEKDLTVWVWPESLWAPISFTKDYLERIGKPADEWKNWWESKDAKVYQFIGQDNIYFYGIAQQAMFMATQNSDKEKLTVEPEDGQLTLSTLVAVNHLLFLGTKASSSGNVKPPMAEELLDYYTAEQLRAHFLGLGLGMKSVSFQPKPLNPKAHESDSDPVIKEGSLLTNVLNRLIRSCFYTAQKYCNGKLPMGKIDDDIIKEANDVILEYEQDMYKFEFHSVMNLLDTYIRNANKYWSKNMTIADKEDNAELRMQVLRNAFHMVRVATVLVHPIAPNSSEMVREYLGFDKDFWSWDRIFDTVYDFCQGETEHKLKELEPRVDFFAKHPSQYK